MPAKHKPTEASRKQVEAYAAVGIPQDDIAAVLDISPKTLRAHYREELDKAAVKANAAVGGALYRQATKEGNTTAMIWWTKSRMGWSEKSQIEHSGSIEQGVSDAVLETMKAIEAKMGGN